VKYVTGAATAIPEPASLINVGIGLVCVGAKRKRGAKPEAPAQCS
jgi:hypothetical protein